MLLKHLCIQKTESKRVIVGTLNTKTNSCVTLVPTEKASSSAQKTKMTPCFENKQYKHSEWTGTVYRRKGAYP